VTFSIFRVFCTRNRKFFNPRQNRHPERSAAPIYPISNGLWRGVEGPRRCLLADAFPSFPTTNYKPNQKSHKLRPERSEVEGPAVRSIGTQLDRKPRLFIGSAAEGGNAST